MKRNSSLKIFLIALTCASIGMAIDFLFLRTGLSDSMTTGNYVFDGITGAGIGILICLIGNYRIRKSNQKQA
jgi:hypothetical protein